MKVLIDNCVPLNNGDAALIFSLENKLKNNNDVEFSTRNFKLAKRLYRRKKWNRSILDFKVFRGIMKISLTLAKIIIFIYLVILPNFYKKFDSIISAPGGYLHSYYGNETEMKVYILYLCKKYLKKNVGIYSQSISSLSNKDKSMLYKYGKELDFIYLRDRKSYDRANKYGLDNITLTKDAAFLLTKVSGTIEEKEKKNKNIAISLRGWDKENRSMVEYFYLISQIVEYLLKEGYNVTFLSTCQGLDGYVDDSIVAKQFLEYSGLKNNNIKVDTKYRDLDDLQAEIRKYDFVIGTRLHMCILSLINRVPAFNISYEEKGVEAYKYLEIPEFSIDFNERKDVIKTLENFLNCTVESRKQLWNKINEIKQEQEVLLSKVVDSKKLF